MEKKLLDKARQVLKNRMFMVLNQFLNNIDNDKHDKNGMFPVITLGGQPFFVCFCLGRENPKITFFVVFYFYLFFIFIYFLYFTCFVKKHKNIIFVFLRVFFDCFVFVFCLYFLLRSIFFQKNKKTLTPPQHFYDNW